MPWYTKLLQVWNPPSQGLPLESPVEEQSKASQSRANTVKKVGLAFVSSGAGGQRQYDPPEFDLEEVTKAYNTESYVRQAIDKYVDLMFKAGWTVEGKNIKAIEYIRMRLHMMGIATGTPIDQFFIEIAEDLVKYHNVFIVKARSKKAEERPNLPGQRVVGLDGEEPIAGYFILSPTTINIARDKHGAIQGYEQKIGDEEIKFKPEQVLHIAYKKERGRAFGTPFLLPVIDDIKALRGAEENVLRLIYKHIFPFYIYQVGLPEPGFEATDEEIDEVRNEIANMTLDAGLVMPERHNIKVVGMEGEALKAENYLQYFENRIFTGLGVSEIQMGRGGAASRSTADALSLEMHDRVKAYQRVMALMVDNYIIDELLMEGGFDPILNPDDNVDFSFNEIELESMVKLENHALYLYEHNGISEDEMRFMIGREPITDRAKMHFELITVPTLEYKTTDPDNDSGSSSGKSKATDNKNKPANQHGQKSGPKRQSESLEESIWYEKLPITAYTEMLNYHWELTKSDVIDLVRQYYLTEQRSFREFNDKELRSILHLTEESMYKLATKYNHASFNHGVQESSEKTAWTRTPSFNHTRYLIRLRDESAKDIGRLLKDLTQSTVKIMRNSTADNAVTRTAGLFSAMHYRLEFIAKSTLAKAYNYGFAAGGIALDRQHAKVIGEKTTCPQCTSQRSGTIELSGDFYKKIPPFHPNCVCSLEFVDD